MIQVYAVLGKGMEYGIGKVKRKNDVVAGCKRRKKRGGERNGREGADYAEMKKKPSSVHFYYNDILRSLICNGVTKYFDTFFFSFLFPFVVLYFTVLYDHHSFLSI